MPEGILDYIYEREGRDFTPHAQLTRATRGRQRPEPEDPTRTAYQRDRDRIVHSKALRRLMHKTQMFLSPEGDHYRTRLTHTLEVMQIARTMARGLRLNEDLTEAVALGHDLGHTPFGHAGEDALDELYEQGFRHWQHSLRIIDILENNGRGLNLTFEVRDGILNHTGDNMAATLEGRLVKFADRIAYINHDIDDAIRAGILSAESIPSHLRGALGDTSSERIKTMVMSLITHSAGRAEIGMDAEIGAATNELRSFMFAEVYMNDLAKGEEAKAKEILRRLYMHYIANPSEIHAEYAGNLTRDGVARTVCDYIAGMTDRFAVAQYNEIFMPKIWKINN